MADLRITRAAALIKHIPDEPRTIVYDETDKTTDNTSWEYIDISTTAPHVVTADVISALAYVNAGRPEANDAFPYRLTNFSFTALYSSSNTPYTVEGTTASRMVSFDYISGIDPGGGYIYTHVEAIVLDLVIKYTIPGSSTETVMTFAQGGYRIFTNPDRTQTYVVYDYDDGTYGKPNIGNIFVASVITRASDGKWYSTITNSVIDQPVGGSPYYPGGGQASFKCEMHNMRTVLGYFTTTALTATNQTS